MLFQKDEAPYDRLFGALSVFSLMLFATILLYMTVFYFHPVIVGDGHEYLGITISFFNHQSPDLQSQDIALRRAIESENNVNQPEIYNYYDYEKSTINGQYYSYHFWLYSLACLPAYLTLHFLNLNVLKCFQITNALLLIFSLTIIIIYAPFNHFKKFIFLLLAGLNPVLLYIIWPHPEVFTYSLVLAAIVFMLAKMPYPAILMASLASLQNPPVSVLTFFLIFYGWEEHGWKLKSLLGMIGVSSISLAQYAFYYFYFHTYSLITEAQYASIHFITLEKVLSLFINLDFGILPYFTVLLIVCLISLMIGIWRREAIIPLLWVVLFLMAIMCSTQINWNGGMMYLSRYATYFLPVLFAIVFLSYNYHPKKLIGIVILLGILITVLTTAYLSIHYDMGAYCKFNPLSSAVLMDAPYLYNPPYEVFAERTLGLEANYSTCYPIVYPDRSHPHKILTDYKHIPDVEMMLNRSLTPSEINNIRVAGIGYINN